MKYALTLALVLALSLVAQAGVVPPPVTVGNVTVTVTTDTGAVTAPDAGLTAYIFTLTATANSGGGIYSVDGRIDATTGYLNQEWFKGTKATPIEDPNGQWGNLTQLQENDDTNIIVSPADMVTSRAPLENLITGTNGTWLAGSADGTQTMAFGLQNSDLLLNYYDIPLARVVLATGSVADFQFQVSDGNKADDVFNISVGAIPEPMTLSLLGAGALALIRRRR